LEKKEPISAFLSPGYITLAAGMNYKTEETDKFTLTLLISPATGELTMVIDTAKIDQTQFSIDENKKTEFNIGASLTNTLSLQIYKDIKLTSSAYLFYDYFEKNNKIKFYQDLTVDMRITVFFFFLKTEDFRYF
jgi:hypothetical protein